MTSALVAVLALAATSLTAPAAEAPAWVREAAAAPVSATGAAVVLLDEAHVTIGADARVRTTRRYVVRINDRAGRDAAAMREVYLPGSGKVRELRGWILRGGGDTRSLGGRETVDVALVNNDVFNEVRVRALAATEEVASGDIFAAEVESEDRLLFAQFEWALQQRWAVSRARRVLTLPEGWRATAIVFNGATPDGERQGRATIWEFRNLPELADEPAMPPFAGRAPRLAVSVFAPASTAAPGQFGSWQQVVEWLQALSEDSAGPAPSIETKARELTTGLASTIDRIGAIARFAQRIQYVSIQTGIGRGGGYQPRPAPLVLERNYGDCKDKAALMRSLLAAIGIESYLVSLYAGDRNYVRPQWPSPQQFNHAIIAVSVPDLPPGVTSGLVHPTLGPLLLFDPTDDQVPVGELPLHEQGSLALIISDRSPDLVRLPSTPASHHRRTRTVEASLDASGRMTARIREQLSGALATAERGSHAALDGAGYLRTLTRRVARAVPRAQVSLRSVEPGSTMPGSFAVAYDVLAADFVQFQGQLALVRLPLEASDRVELPASQERRTAIELEPRSGSERIELTLPDGWTVDEIPKDVALDTPFGRYSLTLAKEPGRLVVTRTLDVPLQTIEPARYSEARAFFDAVRTSDTALVVLER